MEKIESEKKDKYISVINIENKNESHTLCIDMIKNNSVVLEVGAAGGSVTKYLNEIKNCSVYTIEYNPKYKNNLEKYSEEVIIADIENNEWIKKIENIDFDYVLFMDVLEHLHDPKKVLNTCKEIFSDKTEIIISIPNIAHNAILMELMNNDFPYSETGLLDSTHIHFFTYESFVNMINELNFYIYEEKATYSLPNKTEFKQNYNEKNIFLLEKQYGNIYQFIFRIGNNSRIQTLNNIKKKNKTPFYCELYWSENGKFFSEEKCIRREIEVLNNEYLVYFDISNIDSINTNFRIDPINCKAIINSPHVFLIEENGSIINVENFESNSETSNDFYFFNTNDPQLFFSLENIELIKYSKIGVRVSYFVLGDYFDSFSEIKYAILDEIVKNNIWIINSNIIDEFQKYKNDRINYLNVNINNHYEYYMDLEEKYYLNLLNNIKRKMIKRLRVIQEYKIIKNSHLFDNEYYKNNNQYLGEIEEEKAILHYLKHGQYLGIKPCKEFDVIYYLKHNKDVLASNKSPFVHFISMGYLEGRLPSDNFDVEINRCAYDDIERSLIHKESLVERYIKYLKEHNISVKKIFLYIKAQGIINTLKKAKSVFLISNKEEIKNYQYIEPGLTKKIINKINMFKQRPLISIIIPVYNVDSKWLDMAIKSIEKQWYNNWEICLVDDNSTKEDTVKYINIIENKKIKIKSLEKNLNISEASNLALKMAKGEYVALMDHDDELAPDALYEVIKAINTFEVDFIYSDEDKINMNGEYCTPHYKPDYSYDMLNSQNYISHLSVIRKTIIDEVGGFEKGLEGAQDHDLYLKVLEKTDKIYHIPKVLYHWRMIPGSTASEFCEKDYAQEAGRKSVENSMIRQGIDAIVENGMLPGTYRVKYNIITRPLISIIIPFKDMPELLEQCIRTIINKSTYISYEIIGISNNSVEEKTYEKMEELEKYDSRIKFYEYNVEFNYSKINNYAVNNYANGEYILLLNNDIVIINEDWMESMLMFAQRELVGAVGALLYYPNKIVQHAGIIIGIGGVAGHSHKYFSEFDGEYFGRLSINQNFSAITAACLMVKKSKYTDIGGLNENDLKVAFNDVDFCLRLQEKGYKNVYTPYAKAYHHESISRGSEDSKEKKVRFKTEAMYMMERHKDILQKGDPYYNINLSLKREDFSLK